MRGKGHKSDFSFFRFFKSTKGSKRTEQSGERGSDNDLMMGDKAGRKGDFFERGVEKRDKVTAALSLGAFTASSYCNIVSPLVMEEGGRGECVRGQEEKEELQRRVLYKSE